MLPTSSRRPPQAAHSGASISSTLPAGARCDDYKTLTLSKDPIRLSDSMTVCIHGLHADNMRTGEATQTS